MSPAPSSTRAFVSSVVLLAALAGSGAVWASDAGHAAKPAA